MLKRILQKLTDNNAIMFPPVPMEELKIVNNTLKTHNLAEIPTAYAKLLTVTDGLIWDGMELYGLYKKTRKDYAFSDILHLNLEIKETGAIKNKVIIGKTAEAFIVYDADLEKYNVLNRIDFEIIDSFSNLSDALYLYVEPLFL